MTNELVKILEAAYSNYELSNFWFKNYQESGIQFDLNASYEYENKARGLLQAYEIMTDKKIYPFQIEEELELVRLC